MIYGINDINDKININYVNMYDINDVNNINDNRLYQ